MKVEQLHIDGLVLLTPRRFGDDRGWFSEVWNARTLRDAGINADFVQDNHSLSRPSGTLRGLHYQAPPHAQAKLVRCTAGSVWDVAVDVRRGSATFGKWAAATLSAENGSQLWIPEGFLHGFLTLEADSEVVYKCTDYYAPEADGSIRWDSPALAIDWPTTGDPALSDKDAAATRFEDWTTPFTAEGA